MLITHMHKSECACNLNHGSNAANSHLNHCQMLLQQTAMHYACAPYRMHCSVLGVQQVLLGNLYLAVAAWNVMFVVCKCLLSATTHITSNKLATLQAKPEKLNVPSSSSSSSHQAIATYHTSALIDQGKASTSLHNHVSAAS
jgi:hypothetical protein